MSNLDVQASLEGIAIIGMAGRFPGAKTIDEFWENLRNGRESVSFFSDQELLDAGVDPTLFNNPDFVKASAVLQDVDMFDAAFFGYNPREAEMLDPQHRLFLECGWAALENAGYDPEKYSGPIGVYAGASMNSYFVNNLLSNPDYLESVGLYQVMLGSDKDFLTTRLSYKLNLKGPSLDIQTACSTSLVAVQVACQSLLNYQCDMALAGGVSVSVPQNKGYVYQRGMILSPDGHCRAFDADSQGTVGGQGVGIVVLKRLSEALADRDHIYAVIRSAAVNNDGAAKVGFTAPGVEGQTEVIAMAHSLAEVEADSITYVETHGTATPMGDPIEVEALTQAFRLSTDRKNYCAIGSVKTNIGHLDAAAGVASLIKTTMALKHKQIPPSLNYKRPNPKIDFANSPFYVNTALSDWRTDNLPRRAGVSSFGMGGTNAHAVLEEAPVKEVSSPSRPWQLLCLSAKTSSALQAASNNLADHLKRQVDINLPEVAYTLQVGRRAFGHRQVLVCSDREDGVNALETSDPRRVLRGAPMDQEKSVVFMFPGQGSQYVNMGLDLYQSEPVFREQVDFCAEFLKPHLGLDLRHILYPSPDQAEDSSERLNRTDITQPALFTIEFSLAKLWSAWGIQPQAMIGHSIGEYVAACLADVFSLEDALTLVAARGRLMQELPGGAMLVVPLPAEKVRPYLGQKLSLAAINSPSLCVVSGSFETIDELERQLNEQQIDCRRLHTSHAFHSDMMDSILEPFVERVKRIPLKPPQTPFISNLTGTWITATEATDPAYWAKHLRQTVQFADGAGELLKEADRIMLEVGPGNTLSSLVRQHGNQSAGRTVLSSLRHPKERQPDVLFLLNTLGQLWLGGCQVNWTAFYAQETRYRIPLPSYPFERQRYWVEPGKKRQKGGTQGPLSKKTNIADWFYLPSWKRSDKPRSSRQNLREEKKLNFLVFSDDYGVSSRVVLQLQQEGHHVTNVSVGDRFFRESDGSYKINPKAREEYGLLIRELHDRNQLPDRITHLWSITPNERQGSKIELLEKAEDLGFYSLLYLVQALGNQPVTSPLQIAVISNNIQEVVGEETLHPEKTMVLGLCRVIPQEYPNVSCHHIDIVLPASDETQEAGLTRQLTGELLMKELSDTVVAFRGKHRWVQSFEKTQPDEEEQTSILRERGVYLITGGLGNIGLALANYLAQTVQAKLILTGRSNFPAREAWEQWLDRHDALDNVSQKIQRLLALEELGSEVLVLSADVASEDQMQCVMAQIEERFGQLHGVIHAAGMIGKNTFCSIADLDRVECEKQFKPKVHGLLVLEKVVRGKNIDFCLLTSSLASVLGGLGFSSYSAANLFMDGFVHMLNQTSSVPWISVNWDGWSFPTETDQRVEFGANSTELAMTSAEGAKIFERILSQQTVPQVVISTGDLQARIDRWAKPQGLRDSENSESLTKKQLYSRPQIASTYVAPRNKIEESIAQMWEELLGISQVGIHDNFFELGGHSLLATRVISRLREQFQVEMSLNGFFENPTVMSLAEHIGTVRMVVQAMQPIHTTGDYDEEEL